MKRELSWALRALYQRKYRTDQNAISQLQRKANNVLGDPPSVSRVILCRLSLSDLVNL